MKHNKILEIFLRMEHNPELILQTGCLSVVLSMRATGPLCFYRRSILDVGWELEGKKS